jgi:succinyl-CoA synthetase alpha subunit
MHIYQIWKRRGLNPSIRDRRAEMAILVDQNTEILIQGITGREATIRAGVMKGYGTKVVCGVTPGRGGSEVIGIPVYNTVEEAKEKHPNVSVTTVFVAARLAKEAALEALDARIKVVVMIPERLPHQDMLEIIEKARSMKATVLGPNCIGIVSPGKALIGMIGGTPDLARTIFKEGYCGVLSRSGGHTTTVSFYLTQAGVGQSTSIAIGGDAFVGSTFVDLLPLFEKDEQTKAVAAFGEIGTTIEEDAARLIKEGKFTKPFVIYLAGKYMRPDTRFGHAGAVISRGRGTIVEKERVLREAGAYIVDHLGEIGEVVKRALAERGIKVD